MGRYAIEREEQSLSVEVAKKLCPECEGGDDGNSLCIECYNNTVEAEFERRLMGD